MAKVVGTLSQHWGYCDHTRTGNAEELIVWLIGNFRETVSCPLQSSDFTTLRDGSQYIWHMELFPIEPREDCSVCCTVGLHIVLKEAPSNKPTFMSFSVTCSDLNGIGPPTQFYDHEFSLSKKVFHLSLPHDGFSAQKLIKEHLKISVKFFHKSLTYAQNSEKLSINIQQKMVADLRSVFVDKKFSDVVLMVGQIEVPAHRCILAARSPVFAAMFEHDMKEKLMCKVPITDFNRETVDMFLRVLYTSELPDALTYDLGVDLLKISNFYQVTDLKEWCVDFLASNMNCSHAIETLKISDLLGLQNLKEMTLNFIHDNKGQFTNAEKFDVLNKDLLIEVVVRLTSE